MAHHAPKLVSLAALLASLAATPALAQDQNAGDWLEDGEAIPTQDQFEAIESPGFGDIEAGSGDEGGLLGEESLDAETPLAEGDGAAPRSGGDGASGLFDDPEFDDAGDNLGDVEVFDDDVRDAELYGDGDGDAPLDGGIGDDGGLMDGGGIMDNGAVGANGLDNL